VVLENSRLKRIIADHVLEISMLKDLQSQNGEPGATSRGDQAPGAALPCVGATCVQGAWPAPLNTALPACAGRHEQRLVRRMNELAAEHPRWGYRTVTTLLVGEGWKVNVKRVRRLWRLRGNRVPRRHSRTPESEPGR
jgi:hypothetical protein